MLWASYSLPTQASSSNDLAQLAGKPGWLKLLHIPAPGGESTGHGSGFFLAPNGAVDPKAELQAMLLAMDQPVSGHDEHVRCRYPARVQWIEKELGQQQAFDHEVNCPAYAAWRQNNQIKSLSVIFATGYLGNPASYYGHTLLKFNLEGPEALSDLMSSTVNYGAIETMGDDPLSYIFKGVFGGYDAGFSQADFYFHTATYGESELRDLWEYRLSLSRREVDYVVAHAWEILGKRYTYFFFRENCAYRMAELLEILDGVEVNPKNRPYTLPQSIVANLGKRSHQGQAMISEVIYHPSRQSRFYQHHRMLSDDDAGLFLRIVREGMVAQADALASRPLTSQQQILDAIQDYYRFSTLKPGRTQQDKPHPEYTRALLARYRLPPGKVVPVVSRTTSPHLGREPSWIQAGISSQRDSTHAILLRIRPAYYDALDADVSHVANAHLSMGDIGIRVARGRVRLHWMDFIAIDSVSPGISGLPGDRGEAWKLKAGLQPARHGCTDCLVPRIEADVGYGRQLFSSVFLAAYIGGGVQDKRHDAGRAFARVTVDAILRKGAAFSMKLSSEQRIKIDAKQSTEQAYLIEGRWALSKSSDIRFAYLRSGNDRETRFGVGLYW